MTVSAKADQLSGNLTAALGWLAALLAGATLVLAPASADAEEGAAPIVFAKATQRSEAMRPELSGFQNTATSAALRAAAPVAGDDGLPPLAEQGRNLGPRTNNDIDAFASAGAIDLRPGAKRLQTASFGPAPKAAPRPTSLAPAANSLRSAPPVVAPGAAFAEPVAGAPYQVDGRWYVPMHEPNYDEVGIASWYGPSFHGKAAANGETFDEMAMTAAHPTLPLPSLVRVTNLENGKSIVVRLNDRGPFVDDRIIDLSKGAALALDMQRKGTAKVRVEYAGPAPVEHNVTPWGGVTQVAVRVEDTAAFGARPLAPLAPAASTHEARPVEPRLPVADPSDARTSIAVPQGEFMLQAGSFADLGNAHKLRDRLSASGPVTLKAVEVDGAEFYRVMMGPWRTRAEAEAARTQLAQAGVKAIVVTP